MEYPSQAFTVQYRRKLIIVFALLSLSCSVPVRAQPAQLELGLPWVSQEPQVNLYIGDRFMENADYDQAIQHYRRALLHNNENLELLRRLVVALRDNNLWIEEGFWEYRRDVHQEELTEALILIYQAQAINASIERNEAWLLDEAHIQRARKKFDLAVKVLEKAQTFHPDNPEVLAHLGKLKAMRSRQGEVQGLDFLRRAVEIEPANSLYHSYLGKALLKNNQEDPALRELYRAARLATEQKDTILREFYRAAQLPTAQDSIAERLHSQASRELSSIFSSWSREKPGGLLMAESSIPFPERLDMLDYDLASRGGTSRADKYDLSRLAALYAKLGYNEKAAPLILRLIERDDTKSDSSYSCYSDSSPEFDFLAKEPSRSPVVIAYQLSQGKDDRLGACVVQGRTHGPTIATDKETPECALAGSAGLLGGDHIKRVDGQETPTLMALANILVELLPGSPVEFEVQRSSKSMILTGRVPELFPSGPPGYLGMEVKAAGEPRHVLVTRIARGGPADKAGLREGDLIEVQGVNGKEVDVSIPTRCLLPQLRQEETVKLRVMRKGDELTALVTLGERPGR